MNEPLTSNTKAILLLTAPLIVGRNARADVLKPREYSGLNQHLHKIHKEPADLIEPGSESLLDECSHVISRDRLQRLLDRGFPLSQAVESWRQRAIWVISHTDETYPQKFRDRMKGQPAILYGCGDHTLLNAGGLAVVGSRHVDEDILEYAKQIGNLAASAGRTIVSGGAKGVDQAAMNGALEIGGKSIGILANGLKGAATNRAHRDPILNEQLVLISPYDPSAGFNVGHAMRRNKLIYALADAALVVNAEKNKGGTWNGAIEQLGNKIYSMPVYVRSTGTLSEGLDALKKKGALTWSNPGNAEDMEAIFDVDFSKTPKQRSQRKIPFDTELATTEMVAESETLYGSEFPQSIKQASGTRNSTITPADELFQAAKSLVLQIAQTPRTRDEIKAELGITQAQANEWLKRLVDEGVLEKRNRPVRYLARRQGLFGKENSL